MCAVGYSSSWTMSSQLLHRTNKGSYEHMPGHACKRQGREEKLVRIEDSPSHLKMWARSWSEGWKCRGCCYKMEDTCLHGGRRGTERQHMKGSSSSETPRKRKAPPPTLPSVEEDVQQLTKWHLRNQCIISRGNQTEYQTRCRKNRRVD